ncbi:MAG: hypothetical protein HYU36_19435 [Planctomycetes bacterium]|nr:hypothetical protein [Planctomycetota bacterium]
MPTEKPSLHLSLFPDPVLLEHTGDLAPRKLYARVDIPEGSTDHYGNLRLFVRVRPLKGAGTRDEMFTEATKGDIHHFRTDNPQTNYLMELVEGYSPFVGGRPVPGPGWFEIFDLQHAGVREDVEAEVFLFRDTGRWCAETRAALRLCSHPARLVKRFPIRETAGLIALGDLDGDGRLEFLLSSGSQRMTVYTFDGQVLWDHDDPQAVRYARYNCIFPICDIDGDGRQEVIGVRRDETKYFLCILDGRTGAAKRRIPVPEAVKILDDPPIINVQVGNLRGLDRPSDILFSHHYSDITAFDSELNKLWRVDLWAGESKTTECLPPFPGAEARFPYGFGHTPALADLDGDGHEEVVAGATLIDHDGRFVWNRKDLPRINADHNDSIAIADLERNGRLSILLSTGLHCVRPDGRSLWGFGHTVCHGQHVRAFLANPASRWLQILLVDWRCYTGAEPPHAVYLLNGDGTVLWHRITGWASGLYWSASGHQDVWLSGKQLPGLGEIVDHEGRFLGYLPGEPGGARFFIRPGRRSDTVVAKATRAGTPYLEFYECAVEATDAGGLPRQPRPDDIHYSLY